VSSNRSSGRARPLRVLDRWSRGHVLMVVAGLVGAALTLGIVRGSAHGTEIVVASHDLRPGDRIGPDDLTTRTVRMDGALLAHFTPVARATSVRGRVVGRRLDAGVPVTPDALVSTSARHPVRTMSIPVDRSRALDGALEAGDAVDVIASSDSATAYAARGVEVVAVSAGSGSLPTSDDHVVVTVVVDTRSALDIARAQSSGDVTLVRSIGARRG
jgi:Flp pilus assembly protein CpaB